MKKSLTIFIFCVNFITANSEILNNAASLWKSLGGKSVSTGANIYQSQSAGHATLGTVYISNPQSNRKLFSVNFPEISINNPCVKNSIINLGGLSYISGDELKNKLQTIIQSSGMGFVYLGLSSVSPVLSETLQEVFSKLQEMGGFLNDDCQAGMMAATFAKDKVTEYFNNKQRQIIGYEVSRKGDGIDLSSVHKKLNKGSGERIEQIATNYPEKRLVNINLAWDSLSRLGIDKETKQLMMTLSGTVIIHENQKNRDSEPGIEYIGPKIINPALLNGLLKGDKSFKILGCQDEIKCLVVKESEQSISFLDSFEHKVSEYFNNFKIALERDEDIDMKTQNFLSKANLPVYMMYDLLWLKTNGNPEAEAGILIEITAWNILYQYLTDLINDSIDAARNYTIGATTELKDFRESLLKTRDILNNFQMEDMNRRKLQVMLVERSEFMGRSLEQDINKVLELNYGL